MGADANFGVLSIVFHGDRTPHLLQKITNSSSFQPLSSKSGCERRLLQLLGRCFSTVTFIKSCVEGGDQVDDATLLGHRRQVEGQSIGPISVQSGNASLRSNSGQVGVL